MRPSVFDNMSWEMGEVYAAVTDKIIINLAKYFPYIKDADEVKGSFEYQTRMLAQMGKVNRETVDIILKNLGGADAALRNTLETAILEALRNEEPALRKAAQQGLLYGEGFVPPELTPNQMQAFQTYYRQSADKMNLVNTVMLESTESAYRATVSDITSRIARTQSILNVGAGEVVTGVSSWNTAMREAVSKMVQNGLTGFIEHGGHHWSPEAYVAMDIRTTMFNTARDATWERNQQYGNDLYQVSTHDGARPLCYPWQGKILSTSGRTGTTTDLDGNTYVIHSQDEVESFRYGGGLFGVNCRHYPMVWIPNVSTIKGTPQDPEENAKAYEESQQQRALERKLREEKRDLEVLKAQGADEEAIRAQKARVRKASADIQDFCDDTGRARHRNREYTPVNAEFPDKDTYNPANSPTKVRDQVSDYFTGSGQTTKTSAENIWGETIKYSEKMNAPKWDDAKQTINELSTQYKTKLKEVAVGAHQAAGEVQISGTIMKLSTTQKDTAIHEFAHSISMERQTKFGLYDESDFWKEIRSLRTAYRKDVGDDAKRWISYYEHSNKSVDEFFAEAFTLGYMREKGIEIPNKYGNDTVYSAKVMEIVRKYFGK